MEKKSGKITDPGTVLEGVSLVKTRELTKAELAAEGWDRPTIALELSNGTLIYASRDDEGNGPGTLFGITQAGNRFYVSEVTD